MFKLKIKISSSNLNEIARFKLQCALLTRIYKSHMKISRISSFESYLDGDAAVEFVLFKAWIIKTDLQECLDEGMEPMLQLNTARISINLQLPCASSEFYSHDSSRFFHFLPSTVVQLYLQMVNHTRTSKKNDEFRWKK